MSDMLEFIDQQDFSPVLKQNMKELIQHIEKLEAVAKAAKAIRPSLYRLADAEEFELALDALEELK